MWVDPISYRLFQGAGSIPASQGRGPIVLMYHSIEPGFKRPESRWAVTAASFAAQMDFLRKHGWKTFLVRDLLAADEMPNKSVVITFDDGYADNFDNGFRILQKHGMCATWFIVSGQIDDRVSWAGGNNQPILNRQQIKNMHEAGMEIGAHTRSHCSLPGMNPSLIWDEIYGSKIEIEEEINSPVTSFAYPFGRYDQNSLDAVKKAGFTIACTTDTGWFGSQKDFFRVRRVPVFSFDSLSSFARKMAFADPEVRWSRMVNYLKNRIVERVNSNWQ